MTRWRTLFLALMATLFAVSGIARAAPAQGGETPPCHAMAMATMDQQTPKPKTPVRQDMLAMNCCLGCLPERAQALETTAPAPVIQPVVFEHGEPLLDGLSPPPELGPPRAARS